MQRRDFLRFTLAGAAGLILAGCGFRLRGFDASSPPLDAIRLAGPDSDLARLVRRRLEAAGTRVHEDAELTLNLGEPEFESRRLSVLDSGPRDEEQSLSARFSVQRADGAYLLDQQRLTVSRRDSVDAGDLLNSDTRREENRDELLGEAADRLLDRLSALGRR
ncbi:MAG: LPS assembly lipoprotein LptE [Halomonas sp.]